MVEKDPKTGGKTTDHITEAEKQPGPKRPSQNPEPEGDEEWH